MRKREKIDENLMAQIRELYSMALRSFLKGELKLVRSKDGKLMVSPAEIVEWARSKNIRIPEALDRAFPKPKQQH